MTLDDNQYNKKPISFESSKMVSNENSVKLEGIEDKSSYKPGSYKSSAPQVNEKLDEMKKKNITHISSDVLFAKNEMYFFVIDMHIYVNIN